MGRRLGSVKPAQKAVRQRAVRGGKVGTARGRRTASQEGIRQKAVPALRWIGKADGRDYYRTIKRRK